MPSPPRHDTARIHLGLMLALTLNTGTLVITLTTAGLAVALAVSAVGHALARNPADSAGIAAGEV